MATIELLYWDGCPSYPSALADLRRALAKLGGDPDAVVVREIAGEEDAAREAFAGSPTIRVDGHDLFPTGEQPLGLTCRLYHRRDGRPSPTPDPLDLRDALRRALGDHR